MYSDLRNHTVLISVAKLFQYRSNMLVAESGSTPRDIIPYGFRIDAMSVSLPDRSGVIRCLHL
jgi:hypothetical protein